MDIQKEENRKINKDKNKDRKKTNKKNNNKRLTVGGVALYNGIMFSSTYRQVQVTRRSNILYCTTRACTSSNRFIDKIPVLRGVFNLGNQIGGSAKQFLSSAGENVRNKDMSQYTISAYGMLAVIALAIPMFISALVKPELRSIIQALVLALEFGLYIAFLTIPNELQTVFMYHGAEHKAVNAYEKYKREDITLEDVKAQSRIHKRCGGNLVVYFVFLMILSCFIPIEDQAIKYLILLAMCLPNIGLAYEIVNIMSVLPKPLDVLGLPACVIQLATTKEPTEEMLELAMYGVLGSIRKDNGITVSNYIKKYTDRIKAKVTDKELDIDVNDIYSVIEYVLNRDINAIKLNKDNILIGLKQEIDLDRLLDLYYIEDYPLQYLTHTQYFFNEKYYVDENVLIPRADSEILVEKALEYINKEEENISHVIDLCTGSGCLGISIARNASKDIDVKLIDISKGALNVACRNIAQNEVADKVTTIESDLLSKVIERINMSEEETNHLEKVDMIVSNPPYIQTEVVNNLDANVQKEPHLALDGGIDGMDFYKRIVKEAKEVLRDGGLLIFEIGYDELDLMKELIDQNKEYTMLESVKDYGGNDRVVICRFQQK